MSDPLNCRQCGAPLHDGARCCACCGQATKPSSTKWVVLGIALSMVFVVVMAIYGQSQLKHSADSGHQVVGRQWLV